MLKKKYLLIGAFASMIGNINAQSPAWLWANGMQGTGYDYGVSAALDASGNIYTAGSFAGTVDFDPGSGVFNLTSAGFLDICISKIDSSGNFVWVKKIGGTGYDWGSSIAIDNAGNGEIYIAGYFEGTVDFDPGAGIFNLASNGLKDIFITKLDSSGNFMWAKAMGGTSVSRCYSIAIDASQNVYATGYFQGTVDFDPGAGIFNLTSAGDKDIFICKLSSSGNFVWAKAMGGASYDYSHSIALDASNNIYTTGYFRGTADFDPGPGTLNLTSVGSYDIYISKLDNLGNLVWVKSMGGTGQIGEGYSIVLDAAGNVYTTGFFTGTCDFDPGAGTFNLTSIGDRDIYISKLNNAGKFIWAKAMGGNDYDSGRGIALDAGGGGVYVTGPFRNTVDFDPGAGIFNLTSAGLSDVFISKLDTSGNFLWAKKAGATNDDNGLSIALDPSGHIHVVGYYSSPFIQFGSDTVINANNSGSAADIFVAKLDTKIITTASIQITSSKQNVRCNSLANGSAQIFVTGGLGPYTYSWNTTPTGTDYFVTGLQGGIFTATVIDQNGWSKTADISIYEPDPLLQFSIITHPTPGMNDGSVNLLVSGGIAPYSYNWSTGATTEDIMNLSSGIYFVTSIDKNSCAKVHVVILN